MKEKIHKLKKKSISWWASVAAIVALIIAIGAWLLPDPIKFYLHPSSQSPSLAETLGITEPIPQKSPGKIRILVAKFDETDQSSNRVSDLILTNLKSSLSTYSDTDVLAINRTITELDGSETAIKIGNLYDASIVIWGWHGLTVKSVPVGVHFDVVPSSGVSAPGGCAASSSQIRNVNPSELSDLTLQTDLSNELSYVTLFALAFARYEAKDWEGSITIFDDAIRYYDPNSYISGKMSSSGILANLDLLYAYRSNAYYEIGDYDSSLADLLKISQTRSSDPAYYYHIGKIYLKKHDYELAIQHFTTAIEKHPSLEFSGMIYYLRGTAYNSLMIFDNASKDFQTAFKLDSNGILDDIFREIPLSDSIPYYTKLINANPNHFVAYYFRGVANYFLDNVDGALKDFDKAIEINPDFSAAREARVDLKIYLAIDYKDPNSTIQDLEILLKEKEFQTPCNLLNLGVQYSILDDEEKAKQYYRDAIAAASKEILSDPNNALAYYIRGMAYKNLGTRLDAYRDFQIAKQLDKNIGERANNLDDAMTEIKKYYIGLTILIFVALIAFIYFISITYLLVKVNFRRNQRRRRSDNKHNAHRP